MDIRGSLASLTSVWPVTGVRVRTPRVELRWPSDDDLAALAVLAARGVHDDGEMPFAVPWTRGTPDEVSRRVVQRHWATRGEWTPEAWVWAPVAVVDGEVVGSQSMRAERFGIARTVLSGSWLGRAHQRRGIGTEMRAAMLHLAFAGLGAERAETESFATNAASLGVTVRLGYRPNGDRLYAVEGQRQRDLRFVLDRAEWERRRRDDIVIEGLDPALALFGARVEEGAASG